MLSLPMAFIDLLKSSSPISVKNRFPSRHPDAGLPRRCRPTLIVHPSYGDFGVLRSGIDQAQPALLGAVAAGVEYRHPVMPVGLGDEVMQAGQESIGGAHVG